MQVELAVWLYTVDGMSLALAAQVAGRDRIAFQKLLAGRDIATAYDGAEDWQRELREMRAYGLL